MIREGCVGRVVWGGGGWLVRVVDRSEKGKGIKNLVDKLTAKKNSSKLFKFSSDWSRLDLNPVIEE